MTPDELLLTRRSVRRYSQTPVPVATLRQIVDVARYAPSGGNAQKWDVILAHEPETVAKVFPTLGWLPVTGAPPEGAQRSCGSDPLWSCPSPQTPIPLLPLSRRIREEILSPNQRPDPRQRPRQNRPPRSMAGARCSSERSRIVSMGSSALG